MGSRIDGNLAISAMDALTSSICVVDLEGTIIGVNKAWVAFASSNEGATGDDFIGINYLELCRTASGSAGEEAADFYAGLRSVLNGSQGLFELEYPCHSAKELRWYLARVTPLVCDSDGGEPRRLGAVVSHMNVTDRKLVQIAYAKLAATDPLTELPNRRFFEEYAEMELARMSRFGRPVALLMLDLDNFKLINDSYGHPVGDAVLKEIATRCKAVIRASDIFARLGGEEFVALLIGSDLSEAYDIAEVLRSVIEDLIIETTAGPIRVTSSIGVTAIGSGEPSIDAAIERADQALYAAKTAGRNRVA